MNARGERILIFGDSLSHHSSDNAPEIWDVSAGSNRTSSAPGDLLASILLESGAQAVRVNANVGRSARNFWTAPNRWQTKPAAQLIASDQLFKPTKVVVMLGTNDADIGSMGPSSIAKIRDTYRAMGAEVIAIGPPVFADARLTTNAAKVYATLNQTFSTVIDARPLSTTTGRAGDGMHFQAAAAKAFAQRLAQQLVEQPGSTTATPSSAWWNVAAIFGGVLGLGLLAVWWARRSSKALHGEKIPAYFVDPESGDVIEVDQQTAAFRHTRNDLLPGGKAAGKSDSAFDPKALAQGLKVELEHTRDREIAKEIAKDHLTEDPHYYTKLKAIHLDGLKRTCR